MSWIKTVNEKDADGLLAEIYDQTTEKFGHVINLVKVQSLSAETISISKNLYRHLMDKPGDLSKFRVMDALGVDLEPDMRYGKK